MNVFHTILQKLGIEKPAEKPVEKPAPAVPPMHVSAGAQVGTATAVPSPASQQPTKPQQPQQPKAVPMVDVVSKLEGLARSHPGLDWKVSIADLLQLLGMDNSYEARKSLAAELGCPENLMHDSASMNVWLHKTVLQKIAENGGNIPASLVNK
jgi:hypothetical protein